MNQDYFNILPPHIQKQFLDNIEAEERDVEEYLSRNSGEDFINDAFTWSNTPQDHHYWNDIHDLFYGGVPELQDFESIYENYPEHSKRDEIINNYQIF